MFYGTFEHTIDEKGRCNVPVKYRDVLRGTGDERLYITNFVTQKVRCLEAYPAAAWLQLETRLREKPQFDPKIVSFFNYYFAGAQECLLDKQGRVLIPPRLRVYAGLEKDVVFTGALDKFRIWNKRSFDPVFDGGEQMLIDDPGFLSQFGI